MSRTGDSLEGGIEGFSPILAPALRVINLLEQEGIIEKPTIGGSIALVFYAQPIKTEDLDIFCFLRQTSLIVSLAPIYKRLQELGYESDGLYINIEGVDIQFLVPEDEITREAVNTGVSINCEGVPIHVFQYEYALAVKASANRPKDWGHIATAVESREPDKIKLEHILRNFDLLDRWHRKLDD